MRIPELALSKSLCLTAGAGAGKTTCLVEAYVGLLSGGADRKPMSPGRIAAITFTDKAAAEMKARVGAKVRGMAGGGEEGQRLLGLLPELEWAPICTIHSFCGSLLREHGLALGLEPDFGILDAHAHRELMEAAAGDLLREAYQAGDPPAMRLLGDGAPQRLAGELITICGELSTLGLRAEKARELSLAAHQRLLDQKPAKEADLARAFANLQEEFDSGKINKKTKLYENLKQILAFWKSVSTYDLSRETLNGLWQGLGGNWGKQKEQKDRAREAIEFLVSLHLAVPLAMQAAGDLLELAARLQARALREEQRRAVISFDRLLLDTRDLLDNHPEVLAQARGQYQALLVDEYQDVNPVQAEIVRLLAGKPGEGGPVLMVVGDPKQSIYAFRGAVVELFELNRASMVSQGSSVVALPENFRSFRVLVDLFNATFEKILQLTDFENLFSEFSTRHQQTAARNKAPASYAGAEILDCRELFEDKQPVAVWKAAEAKALAARISQMREQGAKFRHMAILFRRLTQVELYENALKNSGVPYYTISGGGFFASREVRDLHQAMLAVLQPRDAMALAGFLRSPMVGLSDETLLAMRWQADGAQRSLGHCLRDPGELPDWLPTRQKDAVARAGRMLAQWRRIAGRQRPAELLEVMLDQTSLLAVQAPLPKGEHRVANLRKLLELARNPLGPLNGGVADFVEGLGRFIQSPPSDDSQAPLLGEDADVVRLMTIHKAKGLQFPIVFLPDLRVQPPAPSRAAINREGVLAPKARDYATGNLLETPLNLEALALAKQIEAAESARLFYVACTRAEERLVFCLGGPQGKVGWGLLVEQYMEGREQVEVVKAGDLPDGPACQAGGDGEPEEDQTSKAFEIVNRLSQEPSCADMVAESVSGLEDWLLCPRRYYFTRVLGLDTAMLLPAGGGQGDGDRLALGNLVHAMMEATDLDLGLEGLDNTAQCFIAAGQASPEAAAAALARCRMIWSGPLGQILAATPSQNVEREAGFHLRLAGENGPELLLRGFLDMVIRQGPEGQGLIADYKISDKVEPDKYRNQMLIYCLALWRSNPGGPPPKAGLCFVGSQKAAWEVIEPEEEELLNMEKRLLEAAEGIAGLPPIIQAAQVAKSPDCPGPSGCPLHAFCGES